MVSRIFYTNDIVSSNFYMIIVIGFHTVMWFQINNNNNNNRDHPNYIFENGQNTEKSPGDLTRLAVTQNPLKNHQLKLIGKTHME